MDRRNVIDRLFPVKYDFYDMLNKQAQVNTLGIGMLYKWLVSRSDVDKDKLLQYADDVDEVRMEMESKLIEAFTTPFDRVDIYSISNEMDKIVEYAKSTLLSMEAFEVMSDATIIKMVEKLKDGTDYLL